MLIRMFDVYSSVIEMNQRRSQIPDYSIANAIHFILNRYSNEGLKACPNAIDFDLIEVRCAYLYLYCTSHSHLVHNSLVNFRMESEYEFSQWLWARQGCPKNLLSIGGGPGSDLIGLLLFLQPFISNDHVNCQVLDAYYGWSDVLDDTLETLEMDKYYRDLHVGYQEVDLLRPITVEIVDLLQGADFVTISKFVSAIVADVTAARRLQSMLQAFRPGTLVFFVDNAGGEAFRLGEHVALSSGLIPVWGPVYHFEFRIPKDMEPMSEVLAYPRFGGIRPQTGSKVSLVVWKKMDVPPQGLKRTCSVGNHQIGYGYFNPAPRTTVVARRRCERRPCCIQSSVPVPPMEIPHCALSRTYSLRHTPARERRNQHHRRVVSVPSTSNEQQVSYVPHCALSRTYSLRHTPARERWNQHHRRVVSVPSSSNEQQVSYVHWNHIPVPVVVSVPTNPNQPQANIWEMPQDVRPERGASTPYSLRQNLVNLKNAQEVAIARKPAPILHATSVQEVGSSEPDDYSLALIPLPAPILHVQEMDKPEPVLIPNLIEPQFDAKMQQPATPTRGAFVPNLLRHLGQKVQNFLTPKKVVVDTSKPEPVFSEKTSEVSTPGPFFGFLSDIKNRTVRMFSRDSDKENKSTSMACGLRNLTPMKGRTAHGEREPVAKKMRF